MKRLIVMRHAKSAWDSDAQSDHERPLNDRGRHDAPLVGAELARRGWVPEIVLSSDSNRTRETWERVSRRLPPVARVEFTASLYGAGLGAVQDALEGLPDDLTTVMILGHNPGFEDVASWLSGESIALTTANAALLQHPGQHWGEAIGSQAGWTLEGIVRPKEL